MPKMLKIGQLASKSGLSRDTIRFYEREALLPRPSRTQTGYRLYGPEAVERLCFIKRAQALGFSLTEVRHLLDGYQNPEECAQVQQLLEQKNRATRAEDARNPSLARYPAPLSGGVPAGTPGRQSC